MICSVKTTHETIKDLLLNFIIESLSTVNIMEISIVECEECLSFFVLFIGLQLSINFPLPPTL